MLIDGKRLDRSFSRRTGFASQSDVHEPYSTVRECLQFSALLRQENGRTREEKLEFAEEIIRLLELGTIADSMIGEPGAGLGVEERKRVTIGEKSVILFVLDRSVDLCSGRRGTGRRPCFC